MTFDLKRVAEFEAEDCTSFRQKILPAYEPVLIKGAFNHWPLIRASKQSLQELVRYMMQFNQANRVDVFVSPPEVQGKFYYQQDMRSFNFNRVQVPIDHCVARIINHMRDEFPPGIYMGSTLAELCLPGMMKQNTCDFLESSVQPRLWMGNQTIVQPHFDLSDNIAIVAAGRRRFTLFPPEQIENLYVGPIDVTPAGQPMSLVSLVDPDFEKYPRYKEALSHALVADLEPGDAIYIPSLWWHGVQALDKFNLLVNYWWNNSAAGDEDPYAALIHGILTISALPEKERHAWKHFFDHYVFRSNGHPLEHVPSEMHGVLGEMTPELYNTIRKYLYSRMKR
ncbi:cupin-like domain-containing protein [Cellvibrio sp. pealriver]|uniref:cupin-like domain-containing protein n=1 Tax=Cellvibrio sp. pealriver TaxID=1622269 RepID=UPI00066FF70E|nr:cupin-like domain-containing protein [Cellvibrio sp. pealriver]